MSVSSKIRMARLVKAEKADRSFDLMFWKRMGVEERFKAAWQKERHLSDFVAHRSHRKKKLAKLRSPKTKVSL